MIFGVHVPEGFTVTKLIDVKVYGAIFQNCEIKNADVYTMPAGFYCDIKATNGASDV